ncbi:MAG: hypothetical protein MUF32_01500 [Burkholderiaceae bacterium]|jgi:hypothetical protein|nr:hypothetical protein [Burkholderiaceae bacterium]
MTGRTTILLAALAAAPLALAQPAPPAAPQAPPATPAAQAPAGAPGATEAVARPPPLSDLLRTRVEQVTRGNRVSEVRVTGAGGEPRYTIDVGEARPPEPRQAPGTGLSTPNFLNIEF